MSTTLPSFLNLPLPGVPPPRAYPKAEPAAANGKGKAKAPPSPPPLRLGAEHAGVTMFRMSMSADNWAALLKTAKSGAKSGLRVDFGDDGQGVLRLDDETSLTLGAPKKGGPKTDRHEDVYRVSLPSAASFALHHRSAATAPRLQGLLTIPKGTPSFKVVGASQEDKTKKEQEMGARLREMRDAEAQRKRDHQIHRLEMHEDPMLKGKRKRIVGNGKVAPSPPTASTSAPRPTGPPKPTLLAPKMAKPPRPVIPPRRPSAGGASAPGTPQLKATSSQLQITSSSSGEDASPSRPPAVKAPAVSSVSKPNQVDKVKLGGMERSSSSSGSDVPLAAVADESPHSSQTLPSPKKPSPAGTAEKESSSTRKEADGKAGVEEKKQETVKPTKAAEPEKRDAAPAVRTKPIKKASARAKVFKSAAEVEDSSEDEAAPRQTTSAPRAVAGAVGSKPTVERKEAAPPVQIKKARPPPPPAVVIKKARPPPAPQPKKAAPAKPPVQAPKVAKAPSMAQTASSSSGSSADRPISAEVSKPSMAGTSRPAEVTKPHGAGKRKAAEAVRREELEEGEEEEEGEVRRSTPPKKKNRVASTPSDNEGEGHEEGEVVERKPADPQPVKKRKSDEAVDDEGAKKKAKTDDGPAKPVDAPAASQAAAAAPATVTAPTPSIVQLPKFKRVSNASAQSSRAPSPPGSRGRPPMPRSAQPPQGDWRAGSRGRYDQPMRGRSRSRSPPRRPSGYWSDLGGRSPHAGPSSRLQQHQDYHRGPLPPPSGRARSPRRYDGPVSPDRGYSSDRRLSEQRPVHAPFIPRFDPSPRLPAPHQYHVAPTGERSVPSLFQTKADRPAPPPLKTPVCSPMPAKNIAVPHVYGGGEGAGHGEAEEAAAAATAKQVREALLARAAGRRSGAIPPPTGHVPRVAAPLPSHH